VTAVRIPLLAAGDVFKLYKVSRRKDLDISTFSAAIWLRREAGKILDVRIAYGGVGPMVLRMTKTEAMLRGGLATLEQFERAAEVAKGEVTPITDVRGSEDYRRTLAGNILLKFWHEAMGDESNGNGDGFSPSGKNPVRRLRLPHPA
jgi:xanthine dehydrogenase small subunit